MALGIVVAHLLRWSNGRIGIGIAVAMVVVMFAYNNRVGFREEQRGKRDERMPRDQQRKEDYANLVEGDRFCRRKL